LAAVPPDSSFCIRRITERATSAAGCRRRVDALALVRLRRDFDAEARTLGAAAERAAAERAWSARAAAAGFAARVFAFFSATFAAFLATFASLRNDLSSAFASRTRFFASAARSTACCAAAARRRLAPLLLTRPAPDCLVAMMRSVSILVAKLSAGIDVPPWLKATLGAPQPVRAERETGSAGCRRSQPH
jgi:hypothetical protein